MVSHVTFGFYIDYLICHIRTPKSNFGTMVGNCLVELDRLTSTKLSRILDASLWSRRMDPVQISPTSSAWRTS